MTSDLVFVGTYTDPSRQAGYEVSEENPVMGMTGKTGSAGVHVFGRNAETGRLDQIGSAASVNPSFLALDSRRRWLFAVNEVRTYNGSLSGSVTSFAVDAATGELEYINEVATGGGNPCHLSVSPSDRHLYVANHEAGSIAVIPIDERGQLSPLIDLKVDAATDERASHAHFVLPDPSGTYVMSSNTGTDRVMMYNVDAQDGSLTPNDPPWGETHHGGSPRHLAFSPDGEYLFANGEADLSLSLFRFDATRGRLDYLQHGWTAEKLDDGVRRSTAQLQVHPGGRYVYVSNRGDDNIAVFAFDPSRDRLECIAHVSTMGKTPRNFVIDPRGEFLYAANQNSNQIECFVIDTDTGLLEHHGVAAKVAAPTCILFG
jgi:6-phosphogluconolactonase